MQTPSRARALYGTVTGRNCMSITCPACGAAPAWRCIANSFDADGNAYETGRLKHPHPERRLAWAQHRKRSPDQGASGRST